jgi:hypothetical protein
MSRMAQWHHYLYEGVRKFAAPSVMIMPDLYNTLDPRNRENDLGRLRSYFCSWKLSSLAQMHHYHPRFAADLDEAQPSSIPNDFKQSFRLSTLAGYFWNPAIYSSLLNFNYITGLFESSVMHAIYRFSRLFERSFKYHFDSSRRGETQ